MEIRSNISEKSKCFISLCEFKLVSLNMHTWKVSLPLIHLLICIKEINYTYLKAYLENQTRWKRTNAMPGT